jgi:hypothetical protein
MFAPTERPDEDVMLTAGPPKPAEGKLSDTLATLLAISIQLEKFLFSIRWLYLEVSSGINVQ